jgi:hypothetical protein
VRVFVKGTSLVDEPQVINEAKQLKLIMKGAAFLAIALLLLATIPVLIRCDGTLVNAEYWLKDTDTWHSWSGDLKNGDILSITVKVLGSTPNGLINFYISNSHDSHLLDKTNIGTDGWQGQWTVPYDDSITFRIELASGSDQAIVSVNITWAAGTDGQQPAQQGGGFDPLSIVVVVMVLAAVLISALFIVRLRKQTPLPPPAEGQPPPPP